MSNDLIKVRIFLPHNEQEVIVLRHYIDMIYPSLEGFKDKLFQRYPETKTMKTKLYWIDEHCDKVYIYAEEDFKIYRELSKGSELNFHATEKENEETPSNTPRDFIPTTESFSSNQATGAAESSSATKDKAFHEGVICDGCDGPINGYRYKCIQCTDYDLCMKCENSLMHSEHVMFRIPEPREKSQCYRRFAKRYRSAHGDHHRHHHRDHKRNGNTFVDIITAIANGLTGVPKSEEPNSQTQDKAEEAKMYSEKAESYARCSRDLLSQFSQHFSVMLDPFGANIDVEMEAGPSTPKTKPTAPENNKTEPTAPENNKTEQMAEKNETDKSSEKIQTEQNNQTAENNNPNEQSKEGEIAGSMSKQASAPILIDIALDESDDETISNNRASCNKKPAPAQGWILINNDSIPVVEQTSSPIHENASTSTTPLSSTEIDYIKLARDLENHIRISEGGKKSATPPATPSAASPTAQSMPIPTQTPTPTVTPQAPQLAVPIFHPKKHINDALIQMMAMGFHNESGWLTHLLESTNGDITKAFDLMQPHK